VRDRDGYELAFAVVHVDAAPIRQVLGADVGQPLQRHRRIERPRKSRGRFDQHLLRDFGTFAVVDVGRRTDPAVILPPASCTGTPLWNIQR